MECYKNIPNPFFEEDFRFDSNKFSRQIKKMNAFQDEVYFYKNDNIFPLNVFSFMTI